MAKKKSVVGEEPVSSGGSPLRILNPEDLTITCTPERAGKTALGLDLGIRCGAAWSICRPDGRWEIHPWQIGYWDLEAGRYDSGSLTFLKLRRFLDIVRPDYIGYELVRFTPDEAITSYNAGRILARCATASELLGAMRQVVVMWSEDNGAVCTGYPIGTIKKVATGRGNANKQMMVDACNKQFGTDFNVADCEKTGADDAADAAFILRCLLEEFGETLRDFDDGGSTAA